MSADVAIPAEVLSKASQIRLAVLDVDGVMTDGRLYYDENGKELKAFHAQDGLGIKQLMRYGVAVAVITGRNSPIVANRMAELGIEHVFQGRENKLDTWLGLLDTLDVTAGECLYAGDDLIDLPILTRCGLPVSVPNGRPAVRACAAWVTPNAGGHGAARDVCDLLLQARGVLQDLIENYTAP